MAGKIAKTLGFLGAFAAGIAGYQANAQEVYSAVPRPEAEVNIRIAQIPGLDSLVMTKKQYEATSPQMRSRISPLYFVSKNCKDKIPMYALPGFYNSLDKDASLYLKRAAQEPIGYFISDSIKGKRPIYLIEEGNSKYWYVGPAESAHEAKKPIHQKKTEAKTSARKYSAKGKKKIMPAKQRKEAKPGKLEQKAHEGKRESGREMIEEYDRRRFGKREETQKLAEQPFMRATPDTLMLLKSYGTLTKEQKEAWNKATSDAVENKGFEYARLGLYVRKKAEEQPEERGTRFGIEAAAGTGKEAVAGAFVDIPLASWLDMEGFADGYIAGGNPYVSDLGTQITLREMQLIGPDIHKQRTDDIHTTAEEKAIADIGAGFTFKVTDWLETPLRIALNVSQQEKTLYGTSTVDFYRSGQLSEEQKISNAKNERGTKCRAGLEAGLRFNITDNLSIGGSVNRIADRTGGRINLRCRF
jgi:hypothetical protein